MFSNLLWVRFKVFREYDSKQGTIATEVLDKVKSNFFLFSGQIIFPLQNCKEKLGGG